MQSAIAFDITRLVTRVLNVTPNGIDRIDFALARHFLARADSAGMMATGLGPRVLSGDKARAAVEAIGAHWGKRPRPGRTRATCAFRAELLGKEPVEASVPRPALPRGAPAGCWGRCTRSAPMGWRSANLRGPRRRKGHVTSTSASSPFGAAS